MSETKHSYCMNSTDEHDMLQLMRGFAILLVALQHSIVLYYDSYASMVLISVCVFIDVHIFMFVSGYLFQKKSDEYSKIGIKRFAAKKFQSLGVPYLFWECLFYFGAFILYRLPFSAPASLMNGLGFRKLSLPQILVGLLTFRYSYIQMYWFLFALFWVLIINYALSRYSDRIETMLLLFLIFSACTVLFKNDDYIFIKISRSFLTFGFGRLFQTKCQPSAVNILDDKFPVLIIGYGKRPDYLDVSGYKPFLQFLLIVSIEVGIVSITIQFSVCLNPVCICLKQNDFHIITV